MTKKQRINEILTVYKKTDNKEMSQDDANYICQSLSSFRKVKDIFAESEKDVLEDLFEFTFESNFAYYPSDVIELRLFLMSGKISCKIDTLFSYRFVRKYCYDYPLLLCIDISKSNIERYGGVIIDKDDLDLNDCLKRLYICPKLSKETIDNIWNTVKELCPRIDLVLDLKVPGTFIPKLASHLNEYMVNLYQLNFKSPITTSGGARQAVIDAVNKAWRAHKEKNQLGDVPRPLKWRPSFWLAFNKEPEMWQSIVRKK